MDEKKSCKLRSNILIVIVYFIAIVLIIKLFDLQIIKGAEYREASNTRLTRETVLKASRGNILDASGNKLVSNKMVYNVEIYKTKIDTQTLNDTLLRIIETLEKNGDTYIDKLPFKITNDGNINYSGDQDFDSFKKANKIDSTYNEKQAFDFFKNRYQIKSEDINNCRKIMALRYYIELDGYSNTKSVTIAENISNESRDTFNVMSSEFSGVSTSNSTTNEYPFGELASHILGYVAKINKDELKQKTDYDQNDYIGKTGIEKVFEKYLRGQNGIKQIDMSINGVVTDEYISKEAVSGSDIVLTIDSKLQAVTEQALKNNITDMQTGSNGLTGATDASEGAAVVINVKTGEILAMASYPNYNPSLFTDGISQNNWNTYLGDSRNPLINKAIGEISAPGSTFKLVTAIAGLESNKINTSTQIKCTGRYTYYNDYQPYCWNKSGHGYQNVTQAIEHSCNYFFYETGRLSGIDELNKVAKSFGLGQKTGVELPDEEQGILSGPDVDKAWTGGKTIQSAIGQLYNDFTPIQMAKYTAMLAKGGKNIDVTIIKSINNPDGTEVSRNDINQYVNNELNITGNSGDDLNLSDKTINAVKAGMKGVTSDDGGTAAKYFNNFNIEVGGKTGSASVENGRTNAWFIGFAPFDDPQIAVAVYVKNGEHGGYTAPVARDIFAQYLGMNDSQITEDNSAKIQMMEVR